MGLLFGKIPVKWGGATLSTDIETVAFTNQKVKTTKGKIAAA